MKYIRSLLMGSLIIGGQFSCSDRPDGTLIPGIPKITIHCLLPANYQQLFPNTRHTDNKDITVLFWKPVNDIAIRPQWSSVEADQLGTVMRWVFQSDKPVFITTAFQRTGVVACPGDSIQINFAPDSITYAGKGAEIWRLQYDLEQAQKRLEKPVVHYLKIDSLKHYLQWNDYLNKALEVTMNMLDTSTTNIPGSVIQTIKANSIYSIELSRVDAFLSLSGHRAKYNELTAADCSAICDSTLNGIWAQWLRACGDCSLPAYYFYKYNCIQVWKKYHFDIESDSSMNTVSKKTITYYNALKENYGGLLRERLLQYAVADKTIKDLGLINPVTDKILRDYYAQPGFPEYKQWMRNYEDSMRQKKGIVKK